MEQFNKNNPATPHGRDGSTSSYSSSINDSAYSSPSAGAAAPRSRAPSYTPSYMNAQVPIRKPVGAHQPNRIPSGLAGSTMPATNQPAAAPAPPPPPPPPASKGTLLIAIATTPHPSTRFYLRSMLIRRLYKQIVVLGNSAYESQLKQLKIEIYSILGKIGQEVAIQMALQPSLDEAEIYTVISKAVADGEALYGVLCTPAYSFTPRQAASSASVMNIDQAALEASFKTGVAFLQSVAKQAIPNFRAAATDSKVQQSGLFLVTGLASETEGDDSHLALINSAACRSVMTLLVEAASGRGLTIDYAENLLLPEPEPVALEVAEEEKEVNGVPKPAPLNVRKAGAAMAANGYAEPESPTRLWAIYSEMGAAE